VNLHSKAVHRLLGLLTIAASIALYLQIGQYMTRALFPWTRYAYHNDSMEPVDVVLGKAEKTHLRIQKAYFAARQIDSQTIQIEAYLPDMKPKVTYYSEHPSIATRDPTAVASLRASWLFLDLTAIGQDSRRGFFSLLSFYKNSFSPREPQTDSRYLIYDSMPTFDGHGLEYSYNMTRSSVYVPRTSRDYYIKCWGEHTPAYICNLHFIYKDKLRLDISMRPENLSRPEFIQHAVTLFLDRVVLTP
jgi:hypothetical protein